MDLSDHLNPTIISNKFLDRATPFILLAVAIALSLVYTYVNWGNRKNEAKQRSLQTTKSTKIIKFRHFPYFEFPILEGFYTMYRIRKESSPTPSKKETKPLSVKFTNGLDTALKWVSMHEGVLGIELYIGPIKTIFLSDASACQKMLNSSDPGHLSKPQEIYSRVFANWLHKGILNADYELWKTDRKIVARSFTFKALKSDVKIQNNHGKNLIKRWIELSDDNGGIVQGQDLYDTLSTAFIRLIIEFIIGTDPCATEDISKFRDDFFKFKSIISYRIMQPELFIAPIWWLHPKSREFDDIVKRMHSFVMQAIKRYENKMPLQPRKEVHNGNYSDEENEENECLVESMLCQGASAEQIYFEAGTILTAGRDTSEIAIILLLLDLALHLVHQVKCREEVDSFFDKKALDSDFDLHLNLGDLSELKYLERCILESMRLTPSIPFFMRRLDTPFQISDDKIIEKGNNIVISPWVFHRHHKFFPNPEKFDPDRFLPENVKRRDPGSYIPFSGGPRNCIGWKVAINQIKIMTAWILRNFEIFTEDEHADVKLIYEINITPERPYNLILKRRNFIT